MSKPKEKDGCTASCCAAPQPLPQVEDDCGNTDCCSTNDAAKSHCESPSSIGAGSAVPQLVDDCCKPAKSDVGSGCQDDCCAAPKPEAKDGCCSSGSCTGEKAAETTKDDVCCKLSSPGGEEACSDECCRPANSKADFGRQDACCASTAQGSDANDSCCGPKTPIASSANSDGCCASKNENFKDGCCEAVEPKADDSCKDSCCDAEEAAGEKDSSNDLSQDSCKDACCSSKSKSNAADPPCCEGKQKPCCDGKLSKPSDLIDRDEMTNMAKQLASTAWCFEKQPKRSRKVSITIAFLEQRGLTFLKATIQRRALPEVGRKPFAKDTKLDLRP